MGCVTTLGRFGRSVNRFSGRIWPALVILLVGGFATSGCGGSAPTKPATAAPTDPVVKQARAEVLRQLSPSSAYDGPKAGPRAATGKLIVFVAADISNGGIAGVAQGVQQATAAIGWKLRILDGQASVAGRRRAMQEALALKPDGIILGGFDATEQTPAVRKAAALHIPVVGWHAGAKPGPDRAAGLFTNVSTDPLAVARLASDYVIAHSGGRADAVIFYDSQFQIAVEKAQAMKTALERCRQCAVLRMVDVPIAQAPERMPALLALLLRRFGARLTYLLAINGNYFATSAAALFSLGKSGADPPFAVAAGDGDASEFERIRSLDYQAASVAEPLYLQGWQLVDELNRALNHDGPSGYVAPPRLITRADVPSGGVFDPNAPYREDYRRIWGAQ
jgi:ribose transport system substrate-binding protein